MIRRQDPSPRADRALMRRVWLGGAVLSVMFWIGVIGLLVKLLSGSA